MADITTDVLIIGTGPAGSATAALLSTYGIQNMVINRYRWLANTPRAHITNQRTMEVLRDLGREVEDEAYMFATEQDLMGENVFCTSLAGEEIGRMKTWGKHPLSAPNTCCPRPPDERPAADLHGAAAVQDRLFARHPGAHVDRIPVAMCRMPKA
jgi:choline dehydrogenase-like flavoprotein